MCYVDQKVTARAVVILLVLLGMFLGVGCKTAHPRTAPTERSRTEPLTQAQRSKNIESFDKVWATIRDQHWDSNLGGLDWEAVRHELRPKVEQARTMAEARRVMQQMLHRLKQSHFAIIPASVYSDVDVQDDSESSPATAPAKKKGDGTIGADARVINERAIITTVDADSPAAKAGVKPGWEVVAVDGKKIQPMLKKLREALPDNPMRPTILTGSASATLRGSIGETAQLTFRDGRSKTITRTIEFASPAGTKAKFGNLPTFYVTFESKRLESNVGYIAFKPFFDPQQIMQKFAEAMSEYRDADGIIIDLRGNPGGFGAMAMGIGGFFVQEPNQHLGTMKMRAAEIKFVLNPRAESYQRPLAILVDEMSMSTSEILAGGLKDLKRARIFGTRTPGAALPSMVEKLPNGDGFQYAFANYISAGGEPLEGNGVVPDQTVKLDRRSLLQGKDPVIEAAVRWIQAQNSSE